MAGDQDDPTQPDAPGWYADPFSATGSGERYWDGKRWGTNERPLGRHSIGVTTDTRNVVPMRRSKKGKGGGKRRLTGPAAPGRNRQIAVFAGFIALVLAVSVVVPKLTGGGAKPDRVGLPENFVPARPPVGTEAQGAPLGRPAQVPSGSGAYDIALHQDGNDTPVTFDACRPIHYVINPTGAPEGGVDLVHEAIARVSVATGFKFKYDGTTDERPDKQREAYQPDRYDKKRWAPVLIAWSNEAAYPQLAGYIDGVAGPLIERADDGRLVYVSGQVVLDTQTTEVTPATRKAVMLHELGHVMGLDHVPDHKQLMHSEGNFAVNDFADGDLRGLSTLGTQDCVPGI